MGTKKWGKEKVIKLLSNNNDKKWYISKIADGLGISVGTASNYIGELEEEGKVETYKQEGSRAKYVRLAEGEDG